MFVARQIVGSDIVESDSQGVIEDANEATKTLGVHPDALRHRMDQLGPNTHPPQIIASH